MTSLANKVYIVGGWIDRSTDTAVRWVERYGGSASYCSTKWDYMADFPYNIYRHCACADEDTGRLYVTGGTHHNGYSNYEKRDVHYYQVKKS